MDMRIQRLTTRIHEPKAQGKAGLKLARTFATKAPIPTSSSSLKGRVSKPAGVTSRGNSLSKSIGLLARQVPSSAQPVRSPSPFKNR